MVPVFFLFRLLYWCQIKGAALLKREQELSLLFTSILRLKQEIGVFCRSFWCVLKHVSLEPKYVGHNKGNKQDWYWCWCCFYLPQDFFSNLHVPLNHILAIVFYSFCWFIWLALHCLWCSPDLDAFPSLQWQLWPVLHLFFFSTHLQ